MNSFFDNPNEMFEGRAPQGVDVTNPFITPNAALDDSSMGLFPFTPVVDMDVTPSLFTTPDVYPPFDMMPGMDPNMMPMMPGMDPNMMPMVPGMDPNMMPMEPGMDPNMWDGPIPQMPNAPVPSELTPDALPQDVMVQQPQEGLIAITSPTTRSEMVDSDKNGIFDLHAHFEDSNGDGKVDILVRDFDNNQNGYVEFRKIHLDTNQDGQFDQVITRHSTHDDGTLDSTTVEIDSDGDLETDQIHQITLIDRDKNGQYHTAEIAVDHGADGIIEEVVREATPEGMRPVTVFDGYEELLEQCGFTLPRPKLEEVSVETIEDGSIENLTNLSTLEKEEIHPIQTGPVFDASADHGDGIIGDPFAALDVWECQGATNRCALYAQRFVIEEFTGKPVDMGEYLRIAKENGFFTEQGGTTPLCINKMLDVYGIQNEMSFHNTMESLEAALARGERVIVGLDADEIWFGEQDNIFTPFQAEKLDGANHALEVIGIDRSDPNNPMVILNDSGIPNGQGSMVKFDVFEDAWADGNHQMVRCFRNDSQEMLA